MTAPGGSAGATMSSVPAAPSAGGTIPGTSVAIPDVPAQGGNPQNWLTYRHPIYAVMADRWEYALDHYTGDVLDSRKILSYLPRKQTAETIDAYRERTALADYTPHFSTVIDSIAGMLFSVEDEAVRDWGPKSADGAIGGLGDPEDRETVAGRLKDDADGQGGSWLSIWKRLAIDLLITQKTWVLVDSPGGVSHVHLIPVTAVVNWRYQGGALVEALVCEQADQRTSLQEDQELRQQFIHYNVQGWQRWFTDAGGRPQKMTGDGDSGAYAFLDRRARPTLPIFPIELPLRRPVGWMLAKKANAIFNKESERDHLLRTAQLAVKLNVFGENTLFEEIKVKLGEGTSVLQNMPGQTKGHEFIAPGAAPAEIATKILERKVDEFYHVSFREYGDAARQRTATEVRQDLAAGVGAILQLVKGAIDDAENEALWRIEEIEFPDKSKWFKANVERSDDFAVQDINQLIDRLKVRYFGDRIPLGRTSLIAASKQAADWEGLPTDDDEIEAAVALHEIERVISVAGQLPLGPEVEASLAFKFVEALGLLDQSPEEDIKMADGSTRKRRDLILEQIRAAAEAKASASQNASRFGLLPPPLDPGTDPQPPKPAPKPPTPPLPAPTAV